MSEIFFWPSGRLAIKEGAHSAHAVLLLRQDPPCPRPRASMSRSATGWNVLFFPRKQRPVDTSCSFMFRDLSVRATGPANLGACLCRKGRCALRKTRG